MSNDTGDLENVLEGLEQAAAEADGSITVGETVDAFASRSFGALLTMVGLVASLPVIGAIPGVSIVTGTLIILVSAQFLAGRDSPWIPDRLRKLSISAENLEKGVETAKPYAARIDSVIRPRLTQLTRGPVARAAIAVASIVLALLFYPLAAVPGGVWAPSLTIVALGLALVGNDGALAVLGAAGAATSVALILWLV